MPRLQRQQARAPHWLLVLISIAVIAGPSVAEELDADTLKALEATQKVLTTPSERDKAAKSTPEATKADEFLKSVAGNSENTEAIYDLAAKIAAELANEAKGDPDKMQSILDKAKNDPESFANKLSPAERKRLKELADKIEASRPKKSIP